jgi:predicted nucleotidyltransferase
MKKKLKEKLNKLGVAIVYLFGSAVAGSKSPLSDVDIGVVLKNAPSGKKTKDIYHDLYELFTEIYPSEKLDIVFLQESSLSLQYSAVCEGKVLFETDPILTADYKHSVMSQYLDFRPILDYFDKVTMERYAETENPT